MNIQSVHRDEIWHRKMYHASNKKLQTTTDGRNYQIKTCLERSDDVDRLYVSTKEGGRGLASIEDSVDASIQRLEDYMEKHEGGLITAIRNDTDNTMDNRMSTKKQK